MKKIAICDDNLDFCEYLKQTLQEKYGSDICVTTYVDVKSIENDYERGKEHNVADILLMDIDMNGESVIDIAWRIQKRFREIKIIFITGHIEYSTEIFRVNPNNFLVKPIDARKLYEAVDRASRQLDEEEKDCFPVTFKGTVFRIMIRDILYFESEKRTVILHSRSGSWVIYKKLNEVQEMLPDYFVRCHQSYLVNMNEVKSLKPLRLELYRGEEIPVSRPKYRETKERFLEFLGQSVLEA